MEEQNKKVKGTGYANGKHGRGRIFKRGRVYWIQWHANGQKLRESSHSDKQAVAESMLRRRLVGAEDGDQPARTVTYEEMRARLLNKRCIEGKSLKEAEKGLKYLDEFFKGAKITAMFEDRIEEFKLWRKRAGRSNATINRSLIALGEMLSLSAKKIKNPPTIEKLPEALPRIGFLTRDEYTNLLLMLPERVHPIFKFGCHTGMRLGELQSLTWARVDVHDGTIRLEGADTKNHEGRVIPFGKIPELATLIEELYKKRKSERVFDETGFRKAWARACIRSGTRRSRMLWECKTCHDRIEAEKQPWPPEKPPEDAKRPHCAKCDKPYIWKYVGLIFHDLRRTAVRNMVRAGIDESTAMKISGHKTNSVFKRYNIVDTKDVEHAFEKMNDFYKVEDAKLAARAPRPS